MQKLIKVEELVETISGGTEPKSSCRRIAGVYYKIGDTTIENSGDCYYINSKYYKLNTGYIVYDHAIGEYVIKNATSLHQGVVGIDKDGELVQGSFSYAGNVDDLIRLHVQEGDTFKCMSEEVLKDSAYQECLTSGEYFHRNSHPAHRFILPGKLPSGIKNGLPYDSRGITGKAIKTFEDTYSPTYNPTVEKYGNILGDLTFGVEFETVDGYVPKRINSKLGLIPLKDGSVAGLEYVTIPHSGKKGLQALIDSVEELGKRTTYNKDCSIHFHIGNIPRTEEFFLALFKVLCTLQGPMYELFPLYKQYNFGVKRKHYTKPIPLGSTLHVMDKVIDKSNIKSNFNTLYKYLSMGQEYTSVGESLDNVAYHPSDPRGTSKWNIRSRYHWVNLIPLLFGNKQTVEFRLHTPTYDVDKIVNYLVLCASVINYTKKNTKAILTNPESTIATLNFNDVLYVNSGMAGKNYDSVADSVYSYLCQRRDTVFNWGRYGDILGKEDEFSYNSYVKWGNGIQSKSLKYFHQSYSTARRGLNEFRDVPAEPRLVVGRQVRNAQQIRAAGDRMAGQIIIDQEDGGN